MTNVKACPPSFKFYCGQAGEQAKDEGRGIKVAVGYKLAFNSSKKLLIFTND